MRLPFLAPVMALVAGVAAQVALADTALLLVNDRYENGQNLREGRAFERLSGAFQEAGFDVIVASDATGAEMRAALGQVLEAGERERIVIAVMGHFARSGADSWVLGRDVDAPTLASVGGDGLSLSVLLEVAGTVPGRAVVMLGEERRRMDLGVGLANGIGALDVPQGVTILTGAPDDLAGFARNRLLAPGTDLPSALADARGLRAFGFTSSALPFIAAPVVGTPLPPLPPVSLLPTAEETALWNAASELNTVGAYRAYLSRYPAGFYAAEAQARVAAYETNPTTLAEAVEAALNLSREQRAQIQRGLSILDYDTRGIDGIFGTATRTAIQGWQTARGYPVTGYLDAAQINDLSQQAALRTAELEAEARAAQEAEQRADRAYWQVTGQGASEAGLRMYLERYPDGLYADVAEERLDQYERVTRAEAEARDRAAWDVARGQDTVAALTGYLSEYPDGAFTDQANARIAELSGGGNRPSDQEIAFFEAREAALNLPPVTRSLMEQRLEALGLEPGRVDGRFDGETRRAIRRYQRARGLDVTGYLDQITVVRLLAEAVGGVLRLDGVLNR